MPASTLDPVDAALRSSLTRNEQETTSLDSQLALSTKKALLADIGYDNCGSTLKQAGDNLKSKCIIKCSETPKASKPEENMGADESLKIAKCELYPLESVQLGWKNCDWPVGAGMVNMGNTCYLNSTLQALFHVPAFANWLVSDKEHAAKCQELSGVSCITCAMRKTLLDSQRNSNSIRPLLIYNKLRLVCRNLIPGRQEDAHEFLRYLVEAMEKAYLNRFKNNTEFDARTKETTPLNQILGGYLRSAVRCLECGHVSTTFQHFQDLLLDIRKAQTLDEALEGYFSREKLDDESYRCESCRKKVQATKQFSLERAPMVLCVQLKRFSVSNNKITKHLMFRQRLDLTRYVRHRPSIPLIYKLVALVTHMGPTVNCGHYTAVAQAPSGNYYQFDDSMVRPISHQAVFGTNAYIMFYELESPPFIPKSLSCSSSKVKAPATSVANSEECFGASMKPLVNGLTSSKPYGPELPPGKLCNGLVSSASSVVTNGNGKGASSSSSESSDEENVTSHSQDSTSGFIKGSADKDVKQKSLMKVAVCAVSSSESQVTSSLMCNVYKDSPKKSKDCPVTVSSVTQCTAKQLVPYETDDSTNSEDSNPAPPGLDRDPLDSRLSTNSVANNEWQVTSSTDVNVQEPSSSPSKGCERIPAPGKVVSSVSVAGGGTNPGGGVLKELIKMSHNGYSEPVASWNGNRSQLSKEVMNERRDDRKRMISDHGEATRTKHQKISNGSYKSNPGYNPIQEYHIAKNNNSNNNNNSWSHNKAGGGHYKQQFYSGRHRNRNNYHYKSHYNKNYRFRQ